MTVKKQQLLAIAPMLILASIACSSSQPPEPEPEALTPAQLSIAKTEGETLLMMLGNTLILYENDCGTYEVTWQQLRGDADCFGIQLVFEWSETTENYSVPTIVGDTEGAMVTMTGTGEYGGITCTAGVGNRMSLPSCEGI